MSTRVGRRTFIKRAVASTTVASIPTTALARTRSAIQPRGTRPPDVVVVGAGAFGAWTALSLRERGASVTLVDAYGPGNLRATSCDEQRQIRCGYGDREMYARWAKKALDLWKQREEEFGRKLFHPTGRLQVAARWTPEMEAQKGVFQRLSIPFERLNHDELQHRYPQLNFDGIEVAFFEPGSGLLEARNAMFAVSAAFERKGGTVRLAHATLGKANGDRLQSVILDGRDTLTADTFVFACGPWLRKTFPDLLGQKIATPRAEVFYFGLPRGDSRYVSSSIPCVSGEGFYAYPSIGRGLMMAPSAGGLQADPDTQERVVSTHLVKRARELVALRYPGLRDEPIVDSRVCQLENTADRHFIIDVHPQFTNVWIAGGGSGHGFKHGPVIGEYVADCVTGKALDAATRRSFSLENR